MFEEYDIRTCYFPEQCAMDLYNNMIGRTIAQENLNLSDYDLAVAVFRAVVLDQRAYVIQWEYFNTY